MTSLVVDVAIDNQGDGASWDVVEEGNVFLHVLARCPKGANLTSLIHRQSIPLSPVTVLTPSDGFQVIGVDAVHMATATIPDMINIHPVGNGTNKADIEEAMCANLPSIKPSDGIARGIKRALPKPTIRLRINDVVNQGYGILCALMAGDVPLGKPHDPSLFCVAACGDGGRRPTTTQAQSRRIRWRHRGAERNVPSLACTRGASTFIGQDTAIGTGDGWKSLSRAIVESRHFLTSIIGPEVRRARSVQALPGFSLPAFYHKGVI